MPVWCAETVAICSVRGAYEYAGQKCSATARMYVPESLWPEVSGGGEGGKGRMEGGKKGGKRGKKGGKKGRSEGERERGKEEIKREMGEGEVRDRRKVKGGIQGCMETNMVHVKMY